jgi:murein DD-endopeptidase MepM/ murein hydrolase activator NlpD
MAEKIVPVKKGDTLSAIAAANKTSVAAIAAANPNITNLNKISIGQKIVVPVTTPTKTSTNTYAGGVTGGGNPFAAGSGVNTTTLAGINAASGFTGTTVTSTAVTSTAVTTNPTTSTVTTKTEKSRVKNPDGTETVTWSDGTVTVEGFKTYSWTDPNTGQTYKFNSAEELSAFVNTWVSTNDANAAAKAAADANAANLAAANAGAAATRYAADLAAAQEAERLRLERGSAYAILELEFNKYGLGDLAKTVKDLILTGTPSAEATLKLRNTKQYQTRFAGNEARRAAGKNVYSEDVYLQLENQMQEAFAAYGVSGVLGSSRENQQAKLATFIGADIAPTEVKKRIQMAVEEVNNRPDILKTFQTYYPSVTDKDLVSYFLDPKETETRLTTKVQAAQIGSAASRQGLVTNVLSAEELAALGVTEATANTGYQKVASVLPTAMKLGELEGDAYTQAEAEGAYLKGLASEQRKLADLAAREQNRFLGASGASKGAYASGYLNRTSSAGQY